MGNGGMGGGRRKREECGPLKSGKRRDDIKEEEEEEEERRVSKNAALFLRFFTGERKACRASPLDGCIVDFLRFSFSFSIFGFNGGCWGGDVVTFIFIFETSKVSPKKGLYIFLMGSPQTEERIFCFIIFAGDGGKIRRRPLSSSLLWLCP